MRKRRSLSGLLSQRPLTFKRAWEIRVGWNVIGRKNTMGRPIQGGVWFPDNTANRTELAAIVAAGNASYGPRSH